MSSCCFCLRSKNNPPVNDTPGDLRHDNKIRHSERKIEEDLHLETYMSDYLDDKNGVKMKGKQNPKQKPRLNHLDTLNVEHSEHNNTKMFLMQSEAALDNRDKS